MTEYFVGRNDELEAFEQCLHGPKNGIYFYGQGGVGKTQLLHRIIAVSKEELRLPTSSLIDFFSTKNHSIEGVQNSIIEQIGNPQSFQEIFALRQRLREARNATDNGTDNGTPPPGLIASLQRRIGGLFARCCNEAAQDKQIVLVFDSFEYVQERDLGRWFLKIFLPGLKAGKETGIIVVLAGRAKPAIADTPEQIRKYPLSGLGREDIINYVQRIGLRWSQELEPLIQGTQGNPLLIELLRWRGRAELMADRDKLAKIIEKPEVMAREIFDLVTMPTPINRVLWAMATLKRRFDFDMLKYLVEQMGWLRDEVEYEVLRRKLQALPFVKSGEETSHLLHDEVIAPIACIFETIDECSNIRDELFGKIVYEYYPQQIDAAQDADERMYLQVEQLGYILDRDWNAGVERYRTYREEADQQHHYDFEELLWGELSDHFENKPQEQTTALMFERSTWLFENGLHSKREHLTRVIYAIPNLPIEKKLDAGTSLGFALMRQGELTEAERYYQESLKIAGDLPADAQLDQVAMVEEGFYQGGGSRHARTYGNITR